jgi:hypothetical protein
MLERTLERAKSPAEREFAEARARSFKHGWPLYIHFEFRNNEHLYNSDVVGWTLRFAEALGRGAAVAGDGPESCRVEARPGEAKARAFRARRSRSRKSRAAVRADARRQDLLGALGEGGVSLSAPARARKRQLGRVLVETEGEFEGRGDSRRQGAPLLLTVHGWFDLKPTLTLAFVSSLAPVPILVTDRQRGRARRRTTLPGSVAGVDRPIAELAGWRHAITRGEAQAWPRDGRRGRR